MSTNKNVPRGRIREGHLDQTEMARDVREHPSSHLLRPDRALQKSIRQAPLIQPQPRDVSVFWLSPSPGMECCLVLVGNSAGNFGLSRFYTRHRNPAGSGWLDCKLPWENQQGRHRVRWSDEKQGNGRSNQFKSITKTAKLINNRVIAILLINCLQHPSNLRRICWLTHGLFLQPMACVIASPYVVIISLFTASIDLLLPSGRFEGLGLLCLI